MTKKLSHQEQRLESARFLETRLRIILADIKTALSYAEKTKTTALVGEITAMRRHGKDASKKLAHVIDRLKGYVAASEALDAAEVLVHGKC